MMKLWVYAALSFGLSEYQSVSGQPILFLTPTVQFQGERDQSTSSNFGSGALVLSGSGELLAVSDESHNSSRGAAFLYACNSAALSCSSPQFIAAPNSPSGAGFATSIAVSGNARMVAFGAPNHTSTGGIVYWCIYSAAARCGLLTAIVTGDGSPSDQFGASLSFSYDASILVVGAPGRDGGAGAVFVVSCTRDACAAQPNQMLSPPAHLLGNVGLPLYFGWAVALSADGSMIAITAPQMCCAESGRYSVGFVFTVSCSTNIWGLPWCQAPHQLQHVASQGEYFGTSVSVDETGAFVAVGAYGRHQERGTVYYSANCGDACALTFLVPEGADPFDSLGRSLSTPFNGASIVVGAPGRSNSSGVAYIFGCEGTAHGRKSCNTSALVELRPSDAVPFTRFGERVALSADTSVLAISASGRIYLSDAALRLNASISWRATHAASLDSTTITLDATTVAGVAMTLAISAVVLGLCSVRVRRYINRKTLLRQNALALLIADQVGCDIGTFDKGLGADWAAVRSMHQNERLCCVFPFALSPHNHFLQLSSRVLHELSNLEPGLDISEWSTETPEIYALAPLVAEVLRGVPYNLGSTDQASKYGVSGRCSGCSSSSKVSRATLQAAIAAAATIAAQVTQSPGWASLIDLRSEDTDRILPQTRPPEKLEVVAAGRHSAPKKD